MFVVSCCPETPQWQRLIGGQLPQPEATALADHLARCDRCLAAVQALNADDTLLAAVQQVRRASPASRDEAIAHLMQRWRKPPPPGPAPDATIGAESAPPTTSSFAYLSPPQEADEIGRLAHYRILRVLGLGGMGVVFLAEDTLLQRPIALKVIKPDPANDLDARTRFLREARATAALKSDHIVTIHQVGEDHEVPFLAMELLQGEALDKWLGRGRKPTVPQVLRMGREMARGLRTAHERGVIHRDIKPGNIWLEAPQGRVKLLDFGLARVASLGCKPDVMHLTDSGLIVGTPAYMAPEQARAEAVDARTDLYSLGCVLYRLCTGRLPFEAETTMALLTALALDTPTPVQELNAEIPPALAELVTRLLAKQPADRPQTARAVIEALQAIERSLAAPTAAMVIPFAVPLGPAALASPVRDATEASPRGADIPVCREENQADRNVCPTRRRHRPLLLGAAALVIALVAAPFILLITGKDGRQKTIAGPDDKNAKVVAPVPPQLTKGASPLDQLDPAKIPVAERFDWQPKELVAVLGEHRQRHWSLVYSLAISPDGKTVASGGGDATVRFWDAATGHEQGSPFQAKRNVKCVAYSPDGRTLAVTRYRDVLLADPATRTVKTTLSGHAEDVTAVAYAANGLLVSASGDGTIKLWDAGTAREKASWQVPNMAIAPRETSVLAFAPDSQMLASACTEVEAGQPVYLIRLWDVTTGKERNVLKGHTGSVQRLVFSRDGRTLLSAGSKDATARLWDVATGQEQAKLRLPQNPSKVHAVALAPDGQTVALGGYPRHIWLWDLKEKRGRFLNPGHTGRVTCVTFTLDARTLLSSSEDGTVRFWDVASGTERIPLSGHTGYVVALAFARDGRTLASAGNDGHITLWETADGRERTTLVQNEASALSLAFAPDGQRLAASFSNRLIKLWNARTGQELTTIKDQFGLVRGLAFSPDGRTLATGDESGAVKIWDVASGKERDTIPASKHHVKALAFSPDGQTLAVSTGIEGKPVPPELKLWDVATRQERATLVGQKGIVLCLAFAPDGRTLASADRSASTVILWETATGKPRATLRANGQDVNGVAFAPDGQTLACVYRTGLVVWWQAATGQKLREWQLPSWVTSVAFAPDGRHLAVGNGNGTIYILRLAPPPPAGVPIKAGKNP